MSVKTRRNDVGVRDVGVDSIAFPIYLHKNRS
jgi:hypothetical protein